MAQKIFDHLNSITQAEYDKDEARKKVAVWVYGNTVSYEDIDFTISDSPVSLNVYSDLKVKGHGGFISNDGNGIIQIEFSNDGNTYGGQHTIKAFEVLEFNDLTIAKIRLTCVSDTSYRVLVA